MRRTRSAKRKRATTTNTVLVSNFTTNFHIRKIRVARFARAVLRQLRYRHTALSLVFVSDRTMSALNWRHLRHRGTTDVLAFPFHMRHHRTKHRLMGEVIISPMRAKMYARKISVSHAHELMRYVCHGVLHLVGERDKTAAGRARMRRREDVILKRFHRFVEGVI